MAIYDMLRQDIMIMDMAADNKTTAIDEMIHMLAEQDIVNNTEAFRQAIFEREAQTSTGLGDGIAMPHAKTDAVSEPAVLFAKSKHGLDYESLDGKPAYLFFMIAVPDGADDTHLQTLAALSRKLIDPDTVSGLMEADTPDGVQAIFRQEEAESSEGDTSGEDETKQTEQRPFVVAVTACPTGIAHTYMAEDSLKKQANKMGIAIRVETNGSDGAANMLTQSEIDQASSVIIAADKNVAMNRFDQKPVLERPVSEGINNAEELINKAVSQDAPIFHKDETVEVSHENEASPSFWRSIYKDLMNGVSHMLPFVVGGGILMAISFLIEGVASDDSELFTFFNTVGSNAFDFLIPILAGYIAMSIADRPGLMPGLVGGVMAVNSNAGFLGGLIAGFLAGYIMLLVKRWFRNLPKSLDGLKSVLIYPVLGLLLTGVLMYVVIDPVFSTINTGMISFLEGLGTGNAIILGGLLGGMMALDMGGPFNKAAYTFSIGIFTDTGDGSLMAAVMVGGMIPPIAIALASTFFKGKFTEEERQSGVTNYVMGLSFITEGAIPFAAADPIRVIGSSVIGAAVGGGLTQLWHSAMPAPHGGIFVIPLADHALLFLTALVIGSVISALILGFWKKPVQT